MRLAVIIPVGPGHELPGRDCAQSVSAAWCHSRGPFAFIKMGLVDDPKGAMGRSHARNVGMQVHTDADWFMFIDADDLCRPDAFQLFGDAIASNENLVAVFGSVFTDKNRKMTENVYPLDWDGLMKHGARGTLSMGCFVCGDVARANPFNEKMDVAEDFDFYLRALHGRPWTKIAQPLVTIRQSVPPAGGPRGLSKIGWREACQAVVDRWKETACPSIPA